MNDTYRTVGRRKEAVARVRISLGKGSIVIDGKPLNKRFPTVFEQETITSPLKAVGYEGKLDISIKVKGGGKVGQTEAIRHGIARALEKMEPLLRPTLKKLGYLTRDPRVKERKKPGLKRARKAPQWAKR
ncbi:MAG: 30S ribosomal protein S9 [bacterium]